MTADTRRKFLPTLLIAFATSFIFCVVRAADVPKVPDGFTVDFYAREPLVRHPVSLAFDRHGRLFVGGGPQFRKPRPDTPGDQIKILTDRDEDGVVDHAHVFAEGFNCIQSIAWKGRDLWVANAPDLTIVRDLDGDDVADEYVKLYTDLGNLEHGLHGLAWGPDGKLYMSKGNSKGLSNAERVAPNPGGLAPKPFRELWNVGAPEGSPDFPKPIVYQRGEYRRAYHDPRDDWGREGGILRCDPDGGSLEIVSRGYRNPWDIAMDAEFNFLGTDNDQNRGDKIFHSFFGAHFGWGHSWSSDWIGHDHPPTVPASGPFFEGSGTGITYYDSEQFPESFRGVFFINDWLRGRVYAFRPKWNGALIESATEELETFAEAGGALFKPSDIEVGPDGALYVLGWSGGYGATFKDGKQTNEGRIFRIWSKAKPLPKRAEWLAKKRSRPYAEWSVDELIEDLGHQIAAWRVDAQDELLRRSRDPSRRNKVLGALHEALQRPRSRSHETWTVWTLLRSDEHARIPYSIWSHSSNARIQGLRSYGERHGLDEKRELGIDLPVLKALDDSEPRIRFAVVQSLWRVGRAIESREGRSQICNELVRRAAVEADYATYYSIWGALRELETADRLRELSKSAEAGVRRAALLALLDRRALTAEEVRGFLGDADRSTASIAELWLRKVAGVAIRAIAIEPDGADFAESVAVKIESDIEGAEIRYTLDGSVPTGSSKVFEKPIEIRQDRLLRVALFRDRIRVSGVREAQFHRLTEAELAERAFVYDIRSESRRRHVFDPRGLRVGQPLYIDRSYRFISVPENLVDAGVVRTANADSGSRGKDFLRFWITGPSTVYFGHDVRVAKKPAWLAERGFEKADGTLESDDTKFDVYQKSYDAGEVVLGGNDDRGGDGGKSNYVVALRRSELRPREKPATRADVEAALATADAERGRRLFFDEGGAHCSRCHRIGDRGNPFAPDLSDVGLRAPTTEIVEAILEPSAKITEGFRTHVVVDKKGRSHVGLVLEESGVSLTLVDTDGRKRVLPNSSIAARERSETSAMPGDYGKLLAPTQVADLVKYLLSCRSARTGAAQGPTKDAPPNAPPNSPPNSPPAKPGEVRLIESPGKIEIRIGDIAFASYVFGDPKISRPYFAHVRAPNGVQVTRRHPPGPDDLNDHATMHPGIWFACGDISGEDYWRLRSPYRFVDFPVEPKGGQGSGRFAVRFALLTKDRKRVIGHLVESYTVSVLRGGFLLDARFEFRAKDRAIAIGDQEEMGLGVRVATDLAVKRKKGGRILDAAGRRDGKGVWGKSAAWCDYGGPLAETGDFGGLLVLSDSQNLRTPWWHARDYGLLVANPFGRQAMTRGEKSRIVVEPQKPLRFRFGVFVHSSSKESDLDYSSVYEQFQKLRQASKK